MASDFDSFWAVASARMNTAVDDIVGDRVMYSLDGVAFTQMPAFAIDVVNGEDAATGLDDDFAVRKRVKISKALVPEVTLSHRIRHPRLGAGTFRPTNSVPQTEGEYWLFDVQKVT